MNPELLITGSSGLLGKAVKALTPEVNFVTRQDYDLRDPVQARTMFERFRPKHVLHLAARVGGVKANALRNANLYEDNILINTNVLRAARECGVAHLIAVLSSCAFHLYSDRASTEKDLHAGEPFSGNLGYSYAKRMLDVQTRLLWQQYGCQYSTIAPVTMYGPHDNFDLEDGHVIGALITKCFYAREQGRPLIVWGSGNAIRQFVFVEDVARLLLRLLDSYESPATVIVAPNEGVTIRELAMLVAKVMGFSGPIKFDASKPEGVLVKRIRSERFDALVPGFAFTSLEAGLRKTVAWFLAKKALVTVQGISPV